MILVYEGVHLQRFLGKSFQFFEENEPPKFNLPVSFDPLAALIKQIKQI